MDNKDLNKRIITISFLAVPILASLISTIHLIDFFSLGNPTWMSTFLAITFEIGSIASFVALSPNVMKKVKKNLIMFIFFVLFLLQLVGNVYFSFDYVNQQLLTHSSWMNTFIEMFFLQEDPIMAKFILALIIGLPIPLVSISFLKSLVNYLDDFTKVEEVKSIVEPILVEPIKEEKTEESIEAPIEIKEEKLVRKNTRSRDTDNTVLSSNTFE